LSGIRLSRQCMSADDKISAASDKPQGTQYIKRGEFQP
jgi:hypothetical protein